MSARSASTSVQVTCPPFAQPSLTPTASPSASILKCFCLSSLELTARELFATSDIPVLCTSQAEGDNAYAALFTCNGSPQLRYGPRGLVFAELAADYRELRVAGAYRTLATDMLPNRQIQDSGVDTPNVLTLYRLMTEPDRDITLLTASASPLNESAAVFHEHEHRT